MLRSIGRHARGNVVGYVALVLALGLGTAWGAGLAKNSVKSKQIKDGQVKSADLADGGVSGTDVAEGTLGQVPSAAAADFATTAGRATSASSSDSAADAGRLDGKDSSEFAPAKAEPWHEVGTPGEPAFRSAFGDSSSGNCDAAGGCEWANFSDGLHNSAAFYRDPYGQVHLKGLVCRAYTFASTCPPSVAGGGAQNDDVYQLPPGYRPAGLIEAATSSAAIAWWSKPRSSPGTAIAAASLCSAR